MASINSRSRVSRTAATVLALVVVVAALAFGAYGVTKSPSVETSYSTITTTFIYTTTTILSNSSSGYEMNCVVTFHGGNAYATTVSGEANVTTLVTSTYSSLINDYTTGTSVSSRAGEAVSTTTFEDSATGFPQQYYLTVCTWLP